MSHHLHLFVGHQEVLRRYIELAPHLRLFRLTVAAELAVLAIDDDVLDALHKIYGTGEWSDTLRLTSSDLAFAAETSKRGALAYVETDYFGGAGRQAAAVWTGGALALRPLAMTSEQGLARPAATWPINAALRLLGVTAPARSDAFEAFGLGQYRSVAEIATGAIPVQTAGS